MGVQISVEALVYLFMNTRASSDTYLSAANKVKKLSEDLATAGARQGASGGRGDELTNIASKISVGTENLIVDLNRFSTFINKKISSVEKLHDVSLTAAIQNEIDSAIAKK